MILNVGDGRVNPELPKQWKKAIAETLKHPLYLIRDLCLLRVRTPKIIKAQPMARIKKSAGIIIAHIAFTLPAYKNKIERKTKAIPAMVSPLILSKSDLFNGSIIKTVFNSG